MNSQQIDYFLEVVRQGSFTKAAQICYTTQPSLSRQISKLEEELGVNLFIRTRAGSELSSIGRKYYELFEEMQKNLQLLKSETERERSHKKIKINIGIPEGWDIRKLAINLEKTMMNIDSILQFSFTSYGYQELLSGMKNGRLDLVICPIGLVTPFSNIEYEEIKSLKNVILYSSNHRQPENGEYYTLSDFKNDTLLMLEQREDLTHGIYQQGFLHRLGIAPDIREYHNVDSILLDVSLDKGFAVFDLWSRGIHEEGVSYMVLDQEMPLCVAWYGQKEKPNLREIIRNIKDIAQNLD